MDVKANVSLSQEYDWALLKLGEGSLSQWQVAQLFAVRYMAAMEVDELARREILERGDHLRDQLADIAGADGTGG